MRWADSDHSAIDAGNGRYIPADPLNADYARLLADGVEIASYVVPIPTPDAVRAACDAKIEAALGGSVRQASMQREAIHLTSVVATGGTLTAEQSADVALFLAINEWESQMIAAREAAIASGTALSAITWPALPSSVTPTWIAGF